MGLITALKLFASRDEQGELRAYAARVQHIVDGLKGADGLEARVISASPDSRPIPLAEIRFLREGGFPFMVKVDRYLRSKRPPIYLDDSRMDEMILQVNPFNLRDEDLDTIVHRVREVPARV